MAEQSPRTKHEAELALPTAEQAEPLRPGEADPAKTPDNQAEALEAARAELEATARSETQPNPLEALKAAENEPGEHASQSVNQELRHITLRRELQRIRRQLPRQQRLLSHVIHQPVVRAVSQAAGQTVTRPSGLLGGGLVAFLGTTAYFYLAAHLGFTYNYLVFLVLLGGGFVLGVALEFLVYLATRSRRGRG